MDPNSGLGGGGSGSERTLGADSASIVGNFIPPRGYALSGKIMLSAIIVLFAVVLLLFALHLYIRWHLHRLALRRRRRRLTRRPLIFASSAAAASCGLDPKTLESIPVLSYSTEGYDGEEVVVECAVCLCEFEQGERLRRLPLCGHSFHVECIDMWFHSHATCPLCRAAVEAAAANQPADAAEVSVPAVSTSNACPLCGRGEYGAGSSSAAASGVAEVRINVHSGDDEESKSTGGAMGALRRILSREMSAPPEEGAAPAAEPPV